MWLVGSVKRKQSIKETEEKKKRNRRHPSFLLYQTSSAQAQNLPQKARMNKKWQKMAHHVENSFMSSFSLSLSAHTLPDDILMPVGPPQSHNPTQTPQQEVGNILPISREHPRSSSLEPGNGKSLSTNLCQGLSLLKLTKVSQTTNSSMTQPWLQPGTCCQLLKNSRHCANSPQAFSPARAAVLRQNQLLCGQIQITNPLCSLGQAPSMACAWVFSYIKQWEARTSALPSLDM